MSMKELILAVAAYNSHAATFSPNSIENKKIAIEQAREKVLSTYHKMLSAGGNVRLFYNRLNDSYSIRHEEEGQL